VPTELPPGSAVAATPTPTLPSFHPAGSEGTGLGRTFGPNDSGAVSGGGRTGGPSGPFWPPIVGGTVLVGLLAVWLIRPRRPKEPEAVYRSVVRLASRLGYKPHPTQTVYEYTGMLADVAPGARDPLGVVATATVEVAYGRRRLAEDRLTALAAAHDLVRRSLLRLAFRLPRPRRKAGPAGKRRKA